MVKLNKKTIEEIRELQETLEGTLNLYEKAINKRVRGDFEIRPILAIDDTESRRVIAVTLKSAPGGRRKASMGDSTIRGNPRIRPFDNQQYYVIVGEESDLLFPLSVHGFDDALPIPTIKEFVFQHKIMYGGKSPPGLALAQIMSTCLSDKIHVEEFRLRPRGVEAILFTNPYSNNRLPKEKDSEIGIYVLKWSADKDCLVIEQKEQKGKTPAHYSSKEVVWKSYKSLTKKFKEQTGKEQLTLREKLIVGVASFVATSSVKIYDHSVFDITTIPFEPPPGNANNARYDHKYIQSLHKAALKLID